MQKELEQVLESIPPLLCDEVLSYIEARLPPSSEALQKTVKEVRARRSSKVLRSLSTEKVS